MDPTTMSGRRRAALGAQAGYYTVTAVWPFVSLRTFLAVTGPKSEVWLVKTVSVLVGAIGAALGTAAARRRDSPETTVLAAGAAASLAVLDAWYVARRRISPVYLADAAAQALVLVGLRGSR